MGSLQTTNKQKTHRLKHPCLCCCIQASMTTVHYWLTFVSLVNYHLIVTDRLSGADLPLLVTLEWSIGLVSTFFSGIIGRFAWLFIHINFTQFLHEYHFIDRSISRSSSGRRYDSSNGISSCSSSNSTSSRSDKKFYFEQLIPKRNLI